MGLGGQLLDLLRISPVKERIGIAVIHGSSGGSLARASLDQVVKASKWILAKQLSELLDDWGSQVRESILKHPSCSPTSAGWLTLVSAPVPGSGCTGSRSCRPASPGSPDPQVPGLLVQPPWDLHPHLPLLLVSHGGPKTDHTNLNNELVQLLVAHLDPLGYIGDLGLV